MPFLAVMAALLFAAPAPAAGSGEKVLLDSDMVEGFDDGVAMVMLANAPGIDLVGVTTLSGNSWVATGTANAIRQLEIEGKLSVPVAMGAESPLRPGRREGMAEERELFGLGRDAWLGSFALDRPGSWQEEYMRSYGGDPAMRPDKRHAADFIIDTVRANPGEISIAAIGPCTNLALAVRKAPDIVALIKRVVYMGGSFYRRGNVTAAAEFNWWFDPEAARTVLRTPFAEQIIIGLDVCEKLLFRRRHYDRLLRTLGGSGQAGMLRSSFAGRMFERDPSYTTFVWDVIAAAIIIDPALVSKELTAFVDVNDQYGPAYGQSTALSEQGPEDLRRARIILGVDQDRFWNLINDTRYWRSALGERQ